MVVPCDGRDQPLNSNLVQVLRMMMPHMHQEDRKRCVSQLMRPSRMKWTEWFLMWLGWRSLWDLWDLNFYSGSRGFLISLPGYGPRGRRGEVGFESSQGSNIKNEVRRPFIIVCSSSFHYIVRIRTNLNTQEKDWVNNFVDPLFTVEYCDNTLSTYEGGLRWLSFKFYFFPLMYIICVIF